MPRPAYMVITGRERKNRSLVQRELDERGSKAGPEPHVIL